MTVALAFVVLVLVHELGHAVPALALGYRVRPFLAFPWRVGVRLEAGSRSRPLTRWVYAGLALGGPAASVALAFGLAGAGYGFWGVASLALGVLNLIPLPGFDGWAVVAALRRRG